MPKRDAQLLLEDILESIDKIERYTAGFDRESFLNDEKTIDAAVRNLEIIGEAARQLPETYTAKYVLPHLFCYHRQAVASSILLPVGVHRSKRWEDLSNMRT